MDVRGLVHEHSNFLVQLFKQVSSTDVNAVVSPISISVALAMAAAGAKGKTLEQFHSCLGIAPDSLHEFCSELKRVVLSDGSLAGGPCLTLATGVWVEQTLPIKLAFKEVIEQKYGAVARSADFVNQAEHSRAEINAWVKDETKGKIEQILPDGALDPQSKLVLANAMYFKGTWQKRFSASDTVQGDFFLSSGETLSVPMMTTSKKQEISMHDTFKVLRLPYSKGQDARSFSMYVILPDERAGLADLEKSFNVDMLERYLVRSNEVPVGQFKLPKFKISAGYEVPAPLSRLGLVHAFSREADFSGIVEQPLFISNVFHKAFVEVNEEGTEAAAATAAVVTLRCLPLFPQAPVDFIADHPFVFVIKEDGTGVVVFVGHVANPLIFQ